MSIVLTTEGIIRIIVQDGQVLILKEGKVF